MARLESQVIRYKSAAETSEKVEDELKVEKRKLQREVSIFGFTFIFLFIIIIIIDEFHYVIDRDVADNTCRVINYGGRC